jgi:hypothetical protein
MKVKQQRTYRVCPQTGGPVDGYTLSLSLDLSGDELF